MKRTSTAALFALIALTLVGCTPSDDAPAPKPAAPKVEETAEPAPAEEMDFVVNDTVDPAAGLSIGDCYTTDYSQKAENAMNPVYVVAPCAPGMSQVIGLQLRTDAEFWAAGEAGIQAEFDAIIGEDRYSGGGSGLSNHPINNPENGFTDSWRTVMHKVLG